MASSVVALLSFSSFGQSSTPPGTLTLAWDPSADPTVVGYRLYEGSYSQFYTNVIDVGSATMATITGLVQGATYYFAVTAYDASGLESAFSGEISYTVPTTTIVPPPDARLTVSLSPLSQSMLSGTGTAGNVFNILATEDLLSWVVVGSVTVSPNGTFQFTDPLGSLAASRFYRLELILTKPSTTSFGSPAAFDPFDSRP